MGLDMFILNDVNDTIQYWRKEPALHVWFQNLARQYNLQSFEFNRVRVPMDLNDIEKLMADLQDDINSVKKGNLFDLKLNYDASGFFWGSNKIDENDLDKYFIWAYEKIQELRIIAKRMKVEGGEYYYYANY